MALTAFQRSILRLLAPSRKELESYVAGGVALNTLLKAPRLSSDIDLFHDSSEAVAKSVAMDRETLGAKGFEVQMLRETPSFAEAMLRRGDESTLIQWVQDSAFRFFPLIEDEELGLALHPFDLATNKVLAMAGRLEARDWVDLLTSIDHLQALGYLLWAACGKDPGYGPTALLQEIRRASRYSQAELDRLDLGGARIDAAALGAKWHGILRQTPGIVEILPVDELGTCVVDVEGRLFTGSDAELLLAIREDRLRFHRGSIGGAWPSFP